MAEEGFKMNELEKGIFEVSIFEGKVLINISSETVACSCVLSGEEARKMSGLLFRAHVALFQGEHAN